MKLNQLVDDAAEKFEVAQAVNFADPSKQAQLQTILTNTKRIPKLFINSL